MTLCRAFSKTKSKPHYYGPTAWATWLKLSDKQFLANIDKIRAHSLADKSKLSKEKIKVLARIGRTCI